MIPLNEYPKEELQELLEAALWFEISIDSPGQYKFLRKWVDEISMAISDQKFAEKQLPFNEPSK